MDVVEDDSGLSLPVATSLKTTMEGFVVVDFDVLLAMDAIADTYSCMRSEFYRGKLKKVKRTHVWYWKINEGRLMIIVGESISPEIAKTVVVRSSFGKAEKTENLGHLMGTVTWHSLGTSNSVNSRDDDSEND
ncbi:hypothetical protein F2Q68_00017673 [Brassica cretica]|uniref:Uncharacterized protein n=1 Tax=Brassica cretica TaxID=69181 RepID=A0A8S9HUT5_BRACR|nr:hypothetical protein F2Q68_00017673 [Brassica cretica]